MNTLNKKIAVIGLWHLGLVNLVGFCEKGYNVVAIEPDDIKRVNLAEGKPPLFEPGLSELLSKNLRKGFITLNKEYDCVNDCDAVVIAFDSPVNENDEVDISPVVDAAKNSAAYLQSTCPVIITSQVPLGSCNAIEEMIKKINSAWNSNVVYTPENLKLGQAIDRFLEPDMIVLGCNNQNTLDVVLGIYEPFKTEKITMDLKSAEMVKHSLNAFLATSISFANELGRLSKILGADFVKVGKALKLDKRIGKKALLMPGLGFSGGTLARDVRQLQKFAEQNDVSAPLIESVFSVNERTFDDVIMMLEKHLGSLSKKTIGILGITYKPETSTVRRSPALKVIQKLNDLSAYCKCYDPQADNQELKEANVTIQRVLSIEELAKNADALVLLTEWEEFKEIDFGKIFKIMKQPIIIDTKNYLDLRTANSFKYEGFGR